MRNKSSKERKLKSWCERQKKQSWEEFGNGLERNFNEQWKLFYRVFRHMRKDNDCPLKYVTSKDGKILTKAEGKLWNNGKNTSVS